MNERILTCVYCGHEYPQDTPAHGSQVLTDHIKVCKAHPLRKAEADIALLRAALVGFLERAMVSNDVIPAEQLELLDAQAGAMKLYADILRRRLRVGGVDTHAVTGPVGKDFTVVVLPFRRKDPAGVSTLIEDAIERMQLSILRGGKHDI